MISTTNTLTKTEFQAVNKVLRKSNTAFRILPVVGYVFIIMGLLSLLINGLEVLPLAILIMGLNFVFLMPLLLNRAANKAFDTNPRISETITYSFSEDTFFTKGESFSSEMSLDKIYKVSETDDFLFIWPAKQSATPISKSDISSEDLAILKVRLTAFSHIINELK
jgi:hypothetical protein